ncbi:MAG: hypothetical protein RLZ45_2205 [Verrucomicrobiota bacterium]|jgi:hypothetical protein
MDRRRAGPGFRPLLSCGWSVTAGGHDPDTQGSEGLKDKTHQEVRSKS